MNTIYIWFMKILMNTECVFFDCLPVLLTIVPFTSIITKPPAQKVMPTILKMSMEESGHSMQSSPVLK